MLPVEVLYSEALRPIESGDNPALGLIFNVPLLLIFADKPVGIRLTCWSGIISWTCLRLFLRGMVSWSYKLLMSEFSLSCLMMDNVNLC